MVVCKMSLDIKKRKQLKAEIITEWWRLRKEECCAEFREELRPALGNSEESSDDWESTAVVVRETDKNIFHT